MIYRWKVHNSSSVFGHWQTIKVYDAETRKDAESIGREWVSNQKGKAKARKSEIVRVSTDRLVSVFYQDSVIGRIMWKSERMEKSGHDPDSETFDSKTFDRLIARYHEIFDLESFRQLRGDLPTHNGRDLETWAEIRASLPDDIGVFYLALFYTDDLVLYDAAGAVFDLLEEEYNDWLKKLGTAHFEDYKGLYVIMTYDLDLGDYRPWDNRVFRGKEETRAAATKHKISGQGYQLTAADDLDFRGS